MDEDGTNDIHGRKEELTQTYEYLISGITSKGWKQTRLVIAEDAEDAIEIMEANGYHDLILHTDYFESRFYQPSKLLNIFRPKDLVRYRTLGRLSRFLFDITILYRKGFVLILLALLILPVHFANIIPFEYLLLPLICIIAIPILFVGYFFFTSSHNLHYRIDRETYWARWNTVLRLLPKLSPKDLYPYEKPLYYSKALAATGQLESALTSFSEVLSDQRMSAAHYRMFRGIICTIGREIALAEIEFDLALELAPLDPQIHIEAAIFQLLHRKNIVSAHDLITRTEELPVPDNLEPMRLFCKGAVQLRWRRFAEAVTTLESAFSQSRQYAQAIPSYGSIVNLTKAFLVLSHSRLGDRSTPRKYFRQIASWLRVQIYEDLLIECEQEVGLTATFIE